MKEYHLDEETTNRYPSLEEAQRASLQKVASAIAQAVREGLKSGRFIVVDGVVVPAESSSLSGDQDALSTSDQ